MLKKATHLAILFSLLSLNTACISFRKDADRYAYLRKGKDKAVPKSISEPYEVVDIAVLDTARTAIPTTPLPDPSGPTNPRIEDDPLPENSLSTQAILTVLTVARSYLGTPYRYGGTTKEGIDCSGLVFSSFLSIEMTLPRTSRGLAESGEVIKPKKIREGDLVFFSSRNDGNINHVGLVTHAVGDEISFIHATVSKGVREDRLDVGYWSERFMKAVRVG